MKTLEEIRHRIGSVEDMRGVVATMKTLAAARIRQFELAADSTRTCESTINLALQILIQDQRRSKTTELKPESGDRIGIVLIGSDQGFCGRFNEVVSQAATQFAKSVMDSGERALRDFNPPVLTVGARLNQLVLDADVEIERTLHVPKSVSDINPVIQQIIPHLETWQTRFGIGKIELFYNQRKSAATYKVKQRQLMPLAADFVQQLANRSWESRSLPVCGLPWNEMFAAVVRQHLFLQLFRAFAESLASENASRIAAMQQAEKNIDERLHELNTQFNQSRQRAITEELLDILSGVEAVSGRL